MDLFMILANILVAYVDYFTAEFLRSKMKPGCWRTIIPAVFCGLGVLHLFLAWFFFRLS
jgi:hypothetical protein